jgi:acetyl-CoA carboxylase carboxyltransferase component
MSDLHTTAGKIEDLRARVEEAVHAGSARAVEKQHAKGKMTARERISALVDEDSFTEIDEFARHRSTKFGMEKNRPYGDGVVIGTATVDGRPIALYSQDFTIMGGSLGEVHAEKIVKIAERLIKKRKRRTVQNVRKCRIKRKEKRKIKIKIKEKKKERQIKGALQKLILNVAQGKIK